MSAQGSGRDAAAAAFARTALDAAVQDIPWDGEGEDAVLGEAWQLCLSLDGPPPRPTDFNTPEPVLGYFEEGGGFSPCDTAFVVRCPEAVLSTAAPAPVPPRHASSPPSNSEVAWDVHSMLKQWPDRVGRLIHERLGNVGSPAELAHNPETVALRSSIVVYRSCYAGEPMPDVVPARLTDAHAYLACQPWVFGHPLREAGPQRSRYMVQLGFVPVCGVSLARAKPHAHTMAGAEVAWRGGLYNQSHHSLVLQSHARVHALVSLVHHDGRCTLQLHIVPGMTVTRSEWDRVTGAGSVAAAIAALRAVEGGDTAVAAGFAHQLTTHAAKVAYKLLLRPDDASHGSRRSKAAAATTAALRRLMQVADESGGTGGSDRAVGSDAATVKRLVEHLGCPSTQLAQLEAQVFHNSPEAAAVDSSEGKEGSSEATRVWGSTLDDGNLQRLTAHQKSWYRDDELVKDAIRFHEDYGGELIALPTLEELGWEPTGDEGEGDAKSGADTHDEAALERAIVAARRVFPLRRGDHVLPVCHQGEVRSQVAYMAAQGALRAAHASHSRASPPRVVVRSGPTKATAAGHDASSLAEMGVGEVVLQCATGAAPGPDEPCACCGGDLQRGECPECTDGSSVALPHGAEGGFDPFTAYQDVDWENYFGYLHGGEANTEDQRAAGYLDCFGCTVLPKAGQRFGMSARLNPVDPTNPSPSGWHQLTEARTRMRRLFDAHYFDWVLDAAARRRSQPGQQQESGGRIVIVAFVRGAGIMMRRLMERLDARRHSRSDASGAAAAAHVVILAAPWSDPSSIAIDRKRVTAETARLSVGGGHATAADAEASLLSAAYRRLYLQIAAVLRPVAPDKPVAVPKHDDVAKRSGAGGAGAGAHHATEPVVQAVSGDAGTSSAAGSQQAEQAQAQAQAQAEQAQARADIDDARKALAQQQAALHDREAAVEAREAAVAAREAAVENATREADADAKALRQAHEQRMAAVVQREADLAQHAVTEHDVHAHLTASVAELRRTLPRAAGVAVDEALEAPRRAGVHAGSHAAVAGQVNCYHALVRDAVVAVLQPPANLEATGGADPLAVHRTAVCDALVACRQAFCDDLQARPDAGASAGAKGGSGVDDDGSTARRVSTQGRSGSSRRRLIGESGRGRGDTSTPTAVPSGSLRRGASGGSAGSGRQRSTSRTSRTSSGRAGRSSSSGWGKGGGGRASRDRSSSRSRRSNSKVDEGEPKCWYCTSASHPTLRQGEGTKQVVCPTLLAVPVDALRPQHLFNADGKPLPPNWVKWWRDNCKGGVEVRRLAADVAKHGYFYARPTQAADYR